MDSRGDVGLLLLIWVSIAVTLLLLGVHFSH